MFIFLLQLRHMLDDQRELYLFAVFSTLIWLLWLVKVLVSRRYRPVTTDYEVTTSVVIPVVDEPQELFRDVLRRIVEQRPGEVIVVINGARNEVLERVSAEFAPKVRWVHTPVPGKRHAVSIGTSMSVGEVTVLVDSDTVWAPDALRELVKPFADATVGGVTTRQRILEPERSWVTRWADWLENTRALYSMPAQSVLGQVGCLPGRTIAFRRNILMRVMGPFLTQRFLGVFLEVSDDRTLTNLTLREGYRTVYQYTSLVYTDAPRKIRKLYRQQLRWARGSQYNTLRMTPWMISHAPLLAVFFLADILLPFLLVGTLLGWVYRAVSGTGINLYQAILEQSVGHSGWAWVIVLMIASTVLSMAIRQFRHLRERPSDFLRLPFFIIVSTLFLMPVRLIGFLRMAHVAPWGTRQGAYAGHADDDLFRELEALAGSTAPTDVVDRGCPAPRRDPSTAGDGDISAAVAPTVASAPAMAAPAPARSVPAGEALVGSFAAPRQRFPRFNPLAAVPYGIAALLLGIEALWYV